MDTILELIFDFIIELIVQGGEEAVSNRRIPPTVRIILLVISGVLFVGIVGLLVVAGILELQEDMVIGVALIGVGVIFAIGISWKLRKAYKNRVN